MVAFRLLSFKIDYQAKFVIINKQQFFDRFRILIVFLIFHIENWTCGKFRFQQFSLMEYLSKRNEQRVIYSNIYNSVRRCRCHDVSDTEIYHLKPYCCANQ